jgi:putative flippase GtrA
MSAPATARVLRADRRESLRIARFCVVGIANSAVTLAVFAALSAVGCPAPPASAIGFAAGAVNSFLLNRRWTFADLAVAHRAFWRFAGIQGLGALLSAAGVAAVLALGASRTAAECVILPCVTVTLYCLSRLLVFRGPAA